MDFSNDNEAMDRNYVVFSKNKYSIPSYCLWTEADIHSQTTEQRLEWWKNRKETEFENVVNRWIVFLED